MVTFQELAASRRAWINDVLIPWCRQAKQRELREAEFDWINIAGRVDPGMTLWTWAWGRFPALIHDGMPGLNETQEVRVTLNSGETIQGYPDARQSGGPHLVILACAADGNTSLQGPFNLDDIAAVELADPQVSANAPDLPARRITTLPQDAPDDLRI